MSVATENRKSLCLWPQKTEDPCVCGHRKQKIPVSAAIENRSTSSFPCGCCYRELLLEQKIPVSVAIENLHFFPEGDDRGKHQALLMRNTQLLYMGLPVGQDELLRIVLVVFCFCFLLFLSFFFCFIVLLILIFFLQLMANVCTLNVKHKVVLPDEQG